MRGLAILGLLAALAGCDDGGGSGGGGGGADGGVADARVLVDQAVADAGAGDDASPPAPDAGAVDLGPAGEGVLEIDPVRVVLRVEDGPPPTQQFTLRRSFPDREPVEVPAEQAVWRVSPEVLGVIDGAGFFTSSGRGGSGSVYATQGGQEVVAALTVEAFDDIVVDGAPPDAPQRFADAPEAEGCGPDLLYPEPLTALPRNMRGLAVQWRRGGFELFAVRLNAGGLEVRWFTDQDVLVPDGDAWTALLNAAIGRGMRLEVLGLGQGRVCRGRVIDLIVDPAPLQGAVYYWSTGDAGIMRLPAGDLQAEPFLAPSVAPEIGCPACHALSRDGNRIAFTRTTFPPFGDLSVSLVDTPRQLLYDPMGVVGYFPSFAPDSSRIVGGAGGALVVRDTDTGMELERLPMPAGYVGGSPDWSWQGTRIAAAVGQSGLFNPIPDVGITRGGIAVWTLQADESWGEADFVVQQEGEETNDRPAFSPDGRYLAFERKGDNNGGGMGNSSARLMIIDESGLAVPLSAANQANFLGNSWPKWSPASNQGRLWLAFSSLRDYGHQLQQAGREEPRPQIWVTGIDPDAPPGRDPSAPAFWLPGQSVNSGNHIPYWAVYEKE
ncbi:MAG: hypothetical protein R3F60_11380 [bacterium]